jgi:hypothetical protein
MIDDDETTEGQQRPALHPARNLSRAAARGEALRVNLVRRKTQQRARSAPAGAGRDDDA